MVSSVNKFIENNCSAILFISFNSDEMLSGIIDRSNSELIFFAY